MGIPQMIEEAEEDIREQKNRIDLELGDLKQDLALYLDQKEQLLYDIAMLRSMRNGTFSSVDPDALARMYTQLSELNTTIEGLEIEVTGKEEVSESLDIDDDNDDSDDDEEDKEEYAETLNASGTWSSESASGSIDLSFPSAGGNITGTFHSCSMGECWSSTASGSFNGESSVSGSISGSGSASASGYDISYSISGSFSGTLDLDGESASGSFTTNTHMGGNTYPDSGSWGVTFDNGL